MPPSLILAAVLAQAAAAPNADAGDLERIRKALEEPAPQILSSPVRRDGLVFRVTVYGRKPDRPSWDLGSTVPSYIRPPAPSYHFDFLQQVTPDAFRAGTVYPAGIPIGTLLQKVGKRIVAAHRKEQEERAREEVRQALAGLLACREHPTRPGC